MVGRDWTHGPVAYVLSAEPASGIAEDMGVVIDLHQGTCRGCTLTSRAEAEKAPFVIVASYPRWKEVIRKRLDPTEGLMQNRLKPTKGHMPTMVRFVTASRELVESASLVPTQLLDE